MPISLLSVDFQTKNVNDLTEEQTAMVDSLLEEESGEADAGIEQSEKTSSTQQSNTTTKEGVEALLESNPELANAVYEALGFSQENSQITPQQKTTSSTIIFSIS